MFNALQLQTLHAAIDRIIPEDDFPGGVEAGVADYLLRQLGRDLAHLAQDYPRFCDALEAEAQAAHGQAFAALEDGQQDDMLTRVEQGEVQADWPLDPAAFFAEFIEHCAEGFYSDPGNGGNRDGVAWRMIGYEVKG
ncbi:MAG: gluconate 2-dehydrogenase subunit 3 family protein [Anaerolineaceae bacterium]|nr:gluconate 2-dehydrogenase subunit 3 family protein [Anaerolineaceae bacterium]